MKHSDILSAIDSFTRALEQLEVPYYISGSVAGSAYGVARATMDVDVVAKISVAQVSALVTMLEADFYIDADMIVRAIKERSSFNMLHLQTMIKIDVFIVKERPYDKSSLSRRKKDTLDAEGSRSEAYFASAEDVILSKLEWFRKGGETSERQWSDILGIVKVQGALLDRAYLQTWSASLGLDDLLQKAFDEAAKESDYKY